MPRKIEYIDLQSKWMGLEVANLARRFLPPDWRKWVSSSGLQLWTMLLLRAGYGTVYPGLGGCLGLRGPEIGGVGTFYRTESEVHYIWGEAGEFKDYTLPELGYGVWREVTNALLRYTSPFPNFDRDIVAADIDALSEELLVKSRGHRVFEALGILGGIWSPAGGVAPNEKTLDNPL